MTQRSKRNEVFMWITLLLLQECQVCLMMNLQIMIRNKQSIQTKNKTHIHERKYFHDDHLIKRQVNDNTDANEVMVAVQNAGELYKKTDPNWAERIKNRECNSSEEEMTRKLWSENGALVLSLYLSSYAVMSYLKGCNELMRDQVKYLIDKVGQTDALDNIEQVVDVLKTLKLASNDDDEEDDSYEDEDDMVDPEGQERSTLNEATYLISRSMHVTESLSDIFLSFNDSSMPSKSIGGLDDILDDSINEYLVMSSMLQEEALVRRKRKTSPGSPKANLNIHQYMKQAFKGHSSITMRSVQYRLLNRVDLISKQHDGAIHINLSGHQNGLNHNRPQLSKRIFNAFTSQFDHFSNLVRNRRQVSGTDNSEIIFIKNAKYPCTLLTFQGGDIFFSNFDELSIYSQLWVYNDGYLQHYQTGFFLTQTSAGQFQPEDQSKPVTKFQFYNGAITVSETSCKVITNTHGYNLTLQTDCYANKHIEDIWTPVTLQESQTDIATITCLFLIQRHDTCKCLTYDKPTLDTKHINEENIVNQLWYWDHEYVRHISTHNYLTSNWTDEPLTLVGLNGGLNQRWKMRNDTLEAMDLPQDSVLILCDETVTVGSKFETDKLDWNVSLVQLHDYGLPSCKNTGYFAIVHDDVPCLTMCVTEMEAEQSLMIKLLVMGIALCTGIPSGLLFLICFTAKEALIAGIVVGIILLTIAAFVLYVSHVLKIKYLTVFFYEFNDSGSGNCLWYEADGGIKNVKHDKFLSFETVGSNDFKTLRLVSDSDQHWSLKNRAIRQKGNCGLTLIMDTPSKDNSDEALQFECTHAIDKYEKWNSVELSESLNFVEQTSCLYFLRLQNSDENSCDVLTTNNVSNEISISLNRPSFDQLFNQLWYLRGEVYFNLYSGEKFNLSASETGTSLDKVAFTDKEAEFGFFGGCERTLYFIKSRENPCLIMTYMNASGVEFTDFQEFNVNNIMDQLWENQNGGLINAISGYQAALFNVTPADYVIFNDDFTSYADKILCPFFVQEKEPPCRLLTANINTEKVFFGPFTSDLAETQLWYRSGNTLVHLYSGMSLRFSGSINFQLASLADTTIPIAYLSHKEGNYTIFIKNDMYNTSVSWRFIYAEEALGDLSIFQCPSYNRSFYFIKQTGKPCVVLTAENENKPPFFDTFNDKNVPSQLWYEENERIINLYSGLVLTMNAVTGKFTMTPHLFYNSLQHIDIIRNSNVLWTLKNMNYNCTIKTVISNDSFELMCTSGHQNDDALEFIGYDALDDISNLLCLFYIRSKTWPCEFLTGYDDEIPLKIRPMTEQLIQQQLFYSKDTYLIHQKSGLFLTYANQSLGLQRGVHINSFQSWEFNEDFLKIRSENKNLALTYSENDGLAYTSELDRNGLTFVWSKVSLDYDFGNDASYSPDCTEHIDIESIDVFFITSTRETCVVLTAEMLGEEPVFKAFDKDNQNFQIWFFRDKHIINVATGLAIMVQFDELTDEHDVVMWNKYTFSTAQKFYLTNQTITLILKNKTCIMSSIKTERSVSIKLDCNPPEPSDLKIVYFNNEGEHLDQITCFFFIKSLMSPCELLTVVKGNLVLRPFSVDSLEEQLWFWKESKLINVKRNTMLSAILNKSELIINLQPINTTDGREIQNHWMFNHGLIKPIETLKGLSIGIWTDHGTVGIKPIDFIGNWFREWIFVNKDEGLKQVEKNMFHCEQDVNLDLYVIRSEHDNCPLLNVVGGSKVSFLKVDDSGKGISNTAWWTWYKEHVCNAQLQLCLAVNISSRPHPDLQPRYAFERSQKWNKQGGLIRNINGIDKLTYSGSEIAISSEHQNSNKQIWKWVKSSQIEDDPKYLRCSRCYNKIEEKAAEIISYIPFIGLLYNIGRSIAYASTNCPSVALSAFKSMLIDVALDLVVLVVSVVSLGSASAFAIGIKTAIRLGFKAGVKVFAQAIKSMVKVAVKSLAKNVVRFVKTGFRRTLRQQMTRMKLNIKAVISSLKQFPATFKTFSKSSLKTVKSFVKEGIRSMKLVGTKSKTHWENGLKGMGLKFKDTFKSMPGVMKKTLYKQGDKLKNQLKQMINKLSKRAENAIKKADEMKMPKKIRCKRSNNECPFAKIGDTTLSKIKTMRDYQNDMIPLPSKFQKDMNDIKSLVAQEKRQYAAVGLRVNGKDELLHKDYARLYSDKVSGDILLDKTGSPVKDINGNLVGNRHTEPFLLKNLDTGVKKHCSSKNPCQVFLFTKSSPCFKRTDYETCLSVISRTCKQWLKQYSTKCVVSFDDIFQRESTFSTWNEVLIQTLKEGKFPKKTTNKAIDEVLTSTENIDSLSSVVRSNFHKILMEPNIQKKLQKFDWPTGKTANMGNFNEEINERATVFIKKELNKIDDKYVDDFFRKSSLKPDELKSLKKLKDDMLSVEDTSNYVKGFNTKFEEFKVNNPKLIKNGLELLQNMKKVANDGTRKKEEIFQSVAIQVKIYLNKIAGEAEAKKLMVEASKNAGEAVSFYQFHTPGLEAG